MISLSDSTSNHHFISNPNLFNPYAPDSDNNSKILGNTDQTTGLNETIGGNLFSSPKSSSSIPWWNEDYTSRIEIVVHEPNIATRENEPLDVQMTFLNETCHKYSIRIVLYDQNGQSEIPSQVWNQTYWKNGTGPLDYSDYIQTATITFSVSLMKDESKIYYLYYSKDPMEDKTAVYHSMTGFQTIFDGSRVKVDTKQLYAEFAVRSTFDVLKFSDEKITGTNYHNPNSMYPSSRLLDRGDGEFYLPDSNGFFRDWLLVGQFMEGTTDWKQYPSISGDFVDPSSYYIIDDYATPTSPAITGSNPSKRWTEYHSTTDSINLEYIYEPDDYCGAYAMVYAYFPQDEPSVYIKIGSDEGGTRVHYDCGAQFFTKHVERTLGTDQDVWQISGGVTAGWHSFMILFEEHDGAWAFRFRLSRTGSTVYTAIPGLKLSLVPQTSINSIQLLETGPIFSRFNVTWDSSRDMRTWDIVSFYQNNPSYQIQRTFWWANAKTPLSTQNWSVTNTNFAPLSTTKLDTFVMQQNSVPISTSTDNMNTNNFLAIWDGSGDNLYTANGIFIGKLSKGNVSHSFSYMNLTAYYDETQVRILPGFKSDINNLIRKTEYRI
jgi:hypothetical protein